MDRSCTNKFILASKTKLLEDDSIDPTFLHNQGLYKFLSLLEAARFGVKTPSALLLLEWNEEAVKHIGNAWGLPLMIRFDYSVRPKDKKLGGIPLYTYKSVRSVCKSLMSENCYPILHPHLDRFHDIYSVGILMIPEQPECLLEVVGEGFDASDIRLGSGLCHEHIRIDILRESILQSTLISQANYSKERARRTTKISKFRQYIKYANANGTLLSSLDVFKVDASTPKGVSDIPQDYNPIPRSHLLNLNQITFTLWENTLGILPPSKEFVASLSFLEKSGWVLWDIYGQWYIR